ncbi:MAG TPA: TIGR01620 family protein [Stellaceae bacterium]|nr:TIGR01620 family protein [Stellaceae bacterium]
MTRNIWASVDHFEPGTEQPTSGEPLGALAGPPPKPRHRGPARWFFGSLALLVVALLAWNTTGLLRTAFAEDVWIGGGFSLLIALVVGSAAWWIIREILTLSRMESVDRARERIAIGLDQGDAVDMTEALATLARTLARRPETAATLARFRAEISDTHQPHQQVALFARLVLEPIDTEAYRAIGRAAGSVGVITTIAPTALIDTALMLWRSVALLREIASLYGYRTGVAGSLHLVRSLVTGAAIVAATDVATQIAVQQMGGAVAEKLAGKLGGGVVAASRTVRLGLLTMQLCRVVPFDDHDLPTMRRLIATLLRSRDEPAI